MVAAFVVCVRLTDPEMCGQDWNIEAPGSPGSPWQPTGAQQKGLAAWSRVLLAPSFPRTSSWSRKSFISTPKLPRPLVLSSVTTVRLHNSSTIISQVECSLKPTHRWVPSSQPLVTSHLFCIPRASPLNPHGYPNRQACDVTSQVEKLRFRGLTDLVELVSGDDPAPAISPVSSLLQSRLDVSQALLRVSLRRAVGPRVYLY